MKKRLLTLSLSTALSTALLTTVLPTTALYASELIGNPAGVENFFNLDKKPGMSISPSVEANDSLRQTHQEELNVLGGHFQRTGVKFTYGTMDYTFEKGILTVTSQHGGCISEDAQEKVDSLQEKLRGWSQDLNTFVKNYILYRKEARDVELLTLMNVLYANMPWTTFRQYPVEGTLDGNYLLTMEQIATATITQARESRVPITEKTINPTDHILLNHLAATVVGSEAYEEEDSIGRNIATFVKGSKLDQTAFEAFFDGILFKNSQLSDLLRNLGGEGCHLPRFKDSKHQESLGAEAALLMIMFQQHLVDPAAVDDLFAVNSKKLLEEQEKYVKSGIEKAMRERFLLSNRLVPEALARQRQVEAERAAMIALGDFANEDNVKAWIAAEGEEAKVAVVNNAQAAVALGEFAGDVLRAKWIGAGGEEAKTAVVADVKAAVTALSDLATVDSVTSWVTVEEDDARADVVDNALAEKALGDLASAALIADWITAEGDDARADVVSNAKVSAEKSETAKVEAEKAAAETAGAKKVS